ncbi:hypothetical protein Glove_527g20 [Diversispora epigaea]|uniref:Protein kinase domain-containing protein n=1 Tax=Diversispora epigaea TaxID=1348612 RepID=A0A397GMN2_9GLOM|nr:hypothetical protein Glove_527g20 [Diversispora epigaea]
MAIVNLCMDDLGLPNPSKSLETDPNNAELLKMRGITYKQLKNYNEALTDFNKSLEIRPNNVHVLRLRGETYQKLEKYNEALTDFNNLLESEPNNVHALKLRGETYQKLEKYNETLTDFDNLLKLEPNNRDLHKVIIDRYNEILENEPNNRDLHEEIIDKYNEILEIEPNNALALRSRGKTYLKLEKYNEASMDFIKVLENEPNNRDLHEEIIDKYNEILEIEPSNVLALSLRGKAYQKYNEASINFIKALENEPNNAFVLRLRGETYQKLENHNVSLMNFDKVLEIESNNIHVLRLRGETHLKLEKYDAALTDFNNLLEKEPNNTLALRLRGETYQKLEKHNESLMDFDKVIKLEPNNRDLHEVIIDSYNEILETEPNNTLAMRSRGETYLKLEKYNAVLTNFNNLLELEPNNYLALRLRGETYQKLEKYNEALTDFNNLLELEPNNVFVLRLRGETYQKLGKYNEALTDFNNLLELEPNNQDLHEVIIDEYNEILEIEPNNTLAMRSRGETYLKLEKYNAVLTDFNNLLELEPNNVFVLRLRGETYQKLGKYNEALTDFDNLLKLEPNNRDLHEVIIDRYNEILEIEPNNAFALRSRGEVYKKLEKYNEALTDFNKLSEIDPNNDLNLCLNEIIDVILEIEPNNALALSIRGETYQKLGNYDKAVIYFNKSLQMESNNAFVLRLRGETHQKLENYNESLTDFDKVLEIESNNIHVLRLRGETYQKLERQSEALMDFNKILKTNTEDISVLNLIIETEKSKIQSIKDTKTQKQQTESRIVNELINWIPYSQFKNIEYIAEGGFGVVNSAIWIKDGENKIKVALKNLHNSKDMTDDFLKEVISHGITRSDDFIIQCYGITKDPNTNSNIMVMEFAEDGSLHWDLRRNFDKINWQTKLERLYCIAAGIEQIHNNNLIHRDLHSGNILMGVNGILGSIRIADLGLCRNVDNSTNHVYGIIPYVAPEIFEDSSYSQASDVYSFGMLMWEFTSGHKPFRNRPHNSDLMCNIRSGLRPEITDDTPDIFSVFMKRCWDSNPINRPNIKEIKEQIYKWCWGQENRDQFIQAEQLRKISVINGNSYRNYNPEAIYKSRPLNSMISLFKLMLIGRKKESVEVECSHSSQDFEINENDFGKK